MASKPLNKKATLLAKIDSTLQLPLTENHKLQIVLRHTLEMLGADRCWLQYPCLVNAESYTVPIEQTTPDYLGTNHLKAYTRARGVFSHIAEGALSSDRAVSYNLASLPAKELTDKYQEFQIKSQMASQIPVEGSETWVIGVHHCREPQQYSDEELDILSAVAKKISPSLASLLNVANHIDNIELSSDTLDNNPLPMVIYNLEKKLVYANPAYCQLNERSLNELRGSSSNQHLIKNKNQLALHDEYFKTLLKTGHAFTKGKKATGSGKVIQLENTGSLINYNGARHYSIAVKDTTSETQVIHSLNEALDIQLAILEATDDGILVEDTDRNIITINQNFFTLLGINRPTKNTLKTLELLNAGVGIVSDPAATVKLINALKPSSPQTSLVTINLSDNGVLDLNSFPLIHKEEIKGRVWYFKDVTEKNNLTRKLSYQATHDQLTKLTNRRGFDEKLKEVIQQTQTNEQVHALLYLDLDHFKIINDSSGHAAGDIALIEVSHILSEQLRQSDLLARVGGDEFCILLNSCSQTQAHKHAQKIHAAIDKFVFNWEGNSFNLGVSIGIVTIDNTIGSYETALKLADTSCYLAKDAGRNRIHVHSPSDQSVLLKLQQGNIVNQIQEALRTDSFTCYVQKICSTEAADSSTPCKENNYEVLVRMLDKEGRIVAPHVFLPPAERYSLMYKIDHWVIKHSIKKMALIQDQFEWFSINLSGQTITHDETFELIKRAIEAANIPANKLCFEITETAAISNPQKGIKFLQQLRELGCKVSLDDFGTGLSSYEYLRQLPVDIIKIDGQFVKNMMQTPFDLAVVKSINEIGHTMGIKTIGESVEDRDLFIKLKELGVDFGQGYFLHKPQPLDELITENG